MRAHGALVGQHVGRAFRENLRVHKRDSGGWCLGCRSAPMQSCERSSGSGDASSASRAVAAAVRRERQR